MRRVVLAALIPLLAAQAAPNSTPGTAAPPDPYLWLEEVTATGALDWVKAQNALSTAELEARPDFKPTFDRLLSILDSDARIPDVEKIGPRFYNFWRDAKNPKGLWRRTTLGEYRKAAPKWETVLDIDALARDESENWVWKGASCLPRTEGRCLVMLSRGGADATVVREFDLGTRGFVKGGFTLPEAKSDISWRDSNTLLVATDFGAGSLTNAGYPRILKAWGRGTPLSEAKTLFEAAVTDNGVSGHRTFWKGREREFVQREISAYTSETYVSENGSLVKLDIPEDANAFQHAASMLVSLRTDWQTGGKTYAGGALLAIDFDAFLKGSRQFEVLFQPAERKALGRIAVLRDFIVVGELDNLKNRFTVLSRDGNRWRRVPLQMTETGSQSIRGVDAYDSNEYFHSAADFLTPGSLYYGAIGTEKEELLKHLPAFFNASGLEVTQREAVSRDGTRVPYFQVSRRNLKHDGTNPTLLYGYGGFEIPQLPRYVGSIGAAWLERGGVYVLANIRGGGEFGPAWHQAAIKENRQRSYDDFIAIAEDLIERKVTSTAHLGIQGGSNGGLLTGVMLTERPDLFRAVVCQVPLLDMRRYHHLLAGASWMGEYGNPDKPEEWAYISKYSPYQNVRAGVRYPRTLFTTSTRDDRVHPGHARKMVARMKEQGHNVLYYENIEGGHGGAADNRQSAYLSALAYTFLFHELGQAAGS